MAHLHRTFTWLSVNAKRVVEQLRLHSICPELCEIVPACSLKVLASAEPAWHDLDEPCTTSRTSAGNAANLYAKPALCDTNGNMPVHHIFELAKSIAKCGTF